MKEYESYKILERKYSSNIITGGYVIEGGLKYEPILAPLLPKNRGDELCKKVYKFLSEEN